MAVTAYAAVVSLMHVLDHIKQYPPPRLVYLHRDRIETLGEKVSFLHDFLEIHSQRFVKDLEGLAREIAVVAFEAEEIIDAYVVDQLISQTPPNERDIDLSFFWKIVGEEGEDIIDSHVVGQLDKGSVNKNEVDPSFSLEGLDNVIKKIDSIKKELMMITEVMTIHELGPRVSDPSHSLPPPSSGNNTMVGFDDRLGQIIHDLTRNKCDLQVLPIIGMGALARQH